MTSDGFPPLSGADATVLILGTLPGQISLQRGEYYAQPRNVFWRIMGQIIGASAELPYVERTQRLIDHGIALWDVCATAYRPGSLDSAIQHSSVVPNDLAKFFSSHPHIRLICFNGSKAADLYRRTLLPNMSSAIRNIRRETLPSTSPAHASLPFEEKLSRWLVIRQALSGREP